MPSYFSCVKSLSLIFFNDLFVIKNGHGLADGPKHLDVAETHLSVASVTPEMLSFICQSTCSISNCESEKKTMFYAKNCKRFFMFKKFN